MKSILPFPSVRFSRGEGAVQLRHRRQHPGPDGHVAQGQQARRRRPRRQGQGEYIYMYNKEDSYSFDIEMGYDDNLDLTIAT